MIWIKSITATGAGVAAASLEFAQGLTVVHGASDTGKSYLLDLIDFVFGSQADIRVLPEAKEFTAVEMVCQVSESEGLETFRRRFDSKTIERVSEDSSSRSLKTRHSVSASDNISRLMLAAMGADEWVVIRNQNGDTDTVSFRDVLHLVLGDEDGVLGKAPPFSSGKFETGTKERSLVRCILNGASDPAQVKGARIKEKALSKEQRKLLDRLMGRLLGELENEPSRIEAEGMRQKLAAAVEERSAHLEPALQELDSALQSRSDVSASGAAASSRAAEISESLARFEVLNAQYQSDMERLDVVEEGALILNLHETSTCALCGQSLDVETEPTAHAEHAIHADQNDGSIADAVRRERFRIEMLTDGLRSTMRELEEELSAAQGAAQDAQLAILAATSRLAAAEGVVAPVRTEIAELSQKLASLDTTLAKYEQLDSIDEFRSEIQNIEGQQLPNLQMSPVALSEYSKEVARVLAAWSVPGASTAHIVPETLEASLEGKRRSERGKGVRAILYAAQVVAFAQLCIRKGLPHPGFVVLDSPLVTYKSPKVEKGDTELIDDEVGYAFYRYLDQEFLGQAIVFENVDPGQSVTRGTTYEFSGNDSGRWGFYKVAASGDESLGSPPK
ncbi:hypothetical protein V6K52_09155 [Knoellia sp. S7-12]|uniref:hypothetical protein n=1 Tax=Knoellia sp. S7-12 TaxID=3126698 RepID=UPI003368193A